jgi:DnaJ-class molecular chaperone
MANAGVMQTSCRRDAGMSAVPVPSAGDQENPASQTGEDTCRACNGTGRQPDGAECPACKGTGLVDVPVGDA